MAIRNLPLAFPADFCILDAEILIAEEQNMVFFISGASHTGKTALAQALLEQYHYPYFSIDHLKMGLIRSGNTSLTPSAGDAELTDYLWPIVREMVKTVLENRQNLIVEGCYIPVDWEKDFGDEYRKSIRCIRLVMSECYIRTHFQDIKAFANTVEQRLDDSYCTPESVLADNARQLALCKEYGAAYHWIDRDYDLSAAMSIFQNGQAD